MREKRALAWQRGADFAIFEGKHKAEEDPQPLAEEVAVNPSLRSPNSPDLQDYLPTRTAERKLALGIRFSSRNALPAARHLLARGWGSLFLAK